MRVLITGGAGFIGSHLAERYLDAGHEVIILDDLSTGSIDNIRQIRANPLLTCYVDSISNRPVTAELVDMSEIVYHLAAAVGVRLIVESPVRTIETNVSGTEIILGLASKKRKRVLIASTSEVYGKRTKVPFHEDDDLILGPPHKGRWSYACSKAIDEFLAIAYWREKRVPTTIARFFNTVGPRQTGRYGMVIPNLVRQALMDEDLTVFGDGTQSRCFTHVLDAVRGLMGIAERPEAVGEVYNIGNDAEISIMDLARRIKSLTGSKSRIVLVPYDRAYEEGFEDMARRLPDLSKIKALIGYQPRIGLDQILTDVIEHQRANSGRQAVAAPSGQAIKSALVHGQV
ncbi:MAG TPA: GDP-mannose 4,6-dehydratase [Blastocatellia bacterium]|nr:GDP-mannose 4,6-dehydratase [Blastocatellia bacterium]